MGLRNKILTGYLVLVICIIVIGFFGYQGSRHIMTQFERIETDVVPDMGVVDEIKSAIAGQANDERGFLLTGKEEFVQEISERAAKVDANIEKMSGRAEADEKTWLLQLAQTHKEFTAIQRQVIAAYKSGNIEEAHRLSFEVGRAKRKSLEPIYKSLKESIAGDFKAADESMHANLQFNMYISLGLMLVSIIIGIMLGLYIPYKIVVPIKAVVSRSKQIAAGDFTVREIVVHSRDEVRELAEVFNVMVKNIRELVGEVLNSTAQVAATSRQLSANADDASKATQHVAGAIEEVAAGNTEQTRSVSEAVNDVNRLIQAIEQIAVGAQEQAQTVNRTSETIGQMAASIEDVAANTQLVADSAQLTSEAAEKGGQAVNLSVNGMEQIKAKVYDTAEELKELGEHSQQIGDIIQVIDDIAEQTDLLALNAAIEAARAGEHGKGFAVVADEVRKLAERSGKATKEIAALITNIQSVTAKAVEAMQEGAEEVEKGTSLAHDAGTALKEILKTVDATYNQVQNISAAVQEISASSMEVVTAIENVAGITEENTAATGEMAEGSTRVRDSVQAIASLAQEGAAAAEEVSASTTEMTSSTEDIAASARTLADIAGNLQTVVAKFKV